MDPLNGKEFTEIQWGDEDALIFPLCISSRTDEDHDEKYLGNTVSVARGNVVLCDHGLTETNPPIPDTVPKSTISRPDANCDPCADVEPIQSRGVIILCSKISRSLSAAGRYSIRRSRLVGDRNVYPLIRTPLQLLHCDGTCPILCPR